MALEHERRAGLYDSDNRSVGLPEIIDMIWRRKWYLVGFLLASVGLGAAYLHQTEPVFKVSARVLVQKQGQLLDTARPPRGDEEFLATQAEIIRSPAVVQRAVDSFNLTPPVKPGMDAVMTIISSLSVSPVLGTDVLGVNYRSLEAEETARTVKAIIASYREYLREIEHNSHLEALDLLARNERDLRNEMSTLETQYRELRNQSPLIGLARDSVSLQKAMLTSLGETLNQTKTRRIELEDQLEAMSRNRAANVAGANIPTLIPVSAQGSGFRGLGDLNQPAVEVPFVANRLAAGDTKSLEQELFTAQANEQSLLRTYGEKHPAIKAARGQVAYWERLLKDSQEAAPQVLQQELDAVRIHENHLGEVYKEEYAKAKEVDSYLLQEQQAIDGIQRVQQVHQTVLAQLRQWQLADASLASGRSGITVSVLEPPDLAAREAWPPPFLLLAVCGLVGLVGGFGTISVLERTDSTVRTAEDVQGLLHLPVFGRIPAMATPRNAGVKAVYRGRITNHAPDSPAAEAFRALRTLLKISPENGLGQVIQLSSPRDGEGKSTVTANLAFSFAQLGRRVVVVDADLRNGNLHNIFDVTAARGLTSVLQGSPVEESISHSPLAAVDILPRGPKVANPVELLSQDSFGEVLNQLRHMYDLVLVDSPPLLTVTEASVLAPRTDGVLLNVMIGRSSMTEALEACELLHTHGAKTLGVVVNQVPPGRRSGYYYTANGAEHRNGRTNGASPS
jgi:capsular exopolysaccharide synthesis family protein